MDLHKKYELTDETMCHEGRTLHRIRALVDIPEVGISAGTLGGWVATEKNLSHEGNCWVYNDAKVSEYAEVSENARVLGTAEVYGDAKVCGKARVFGNAFVHGNVVVSGNANVGGNAKLLGHAKVYEYAMVYDNARVYGDAEIHGSSRVYDDARVGDHAKVYGYANVSAQAWVIGNAKVYGNGKVRGNSVLRDGEITGYQDYACFGPIGSRNDFITLNKTTGTVCTGCFHGTLDEFKKAVEKTHGDNEHGRAYRELIAYFRTLVGKLNNA